MDKAFDTGTQKQEENQLHASLGGQEQPMKHTTEVGYAVGTGVGVQETPPTTESRTGPLYSTDTFDSELGEEDTRKHKRDRGSTHGRENDKNRD